MEEEAANGIKMQTSMAPPMRCQFMEEDGRKEGKEARSSRKWHWKDEKRIKETRKIKKARKKAEEKTEEKVGKDQIAASEKGTAESRFVTWLTSQINDIITIPCEWNDSFAQDFTLDVTDEKNEEL